MYLYSIRRLSTFVGHSALVLTSRRSNMAAERVRVSRGGRYSSSRVLEFSTRLTAGEAGVALVFVTIVHRARRLCGISYCK